MKTKLLISVSILFFYGCSSKSPQNKWEYKSAGSFKSYQNNFLSGNIDMAKSDLKMAVRYAKQSADLSQLARIYLGECALNSCIEKNEGCKEYKEITELVDSKELDSYYNMLQNDNLSDTQIASLPEKYRVFIKLKNKEEYLKAFDELRSMEEASSQFIAAALIKEKLTKAQVKYLIEKASFYGYKTIVVYWLKYLKEIENNIIEKEKTRKKIKILTDDESSN